mgnify:CR=1 FL=1
MRRQYKKALITGATSGIGKAFADVLPTGTDLILTGRNANMLQELQTRLAANGRAVEVLEADLRVKADRRLLIDKSEALDIDLFINNAGLGYFSNFTETLSEDESAMVEVNVVAVHELTHALLPGMIKRAKENGQRAGLIIVSSVVGHLPMPYFATYAATKAFDLAFAEGLAEELSREPIDILALCPGATATDFQARAGAPIDMFDRHLYEKGADPKLPSTRVFKQRPTDTYMADVVWCPRCEYPALLADGEGGQLACCGECGFAFCVECRLAWHGLAPCANLATKPGARP